MSTLLPVVTSVDFCTTSLWRLNLHKTDLKILICCKCTDPTRPVPNGHIQNKQLSPDHDRLHVHTSKNLKIATGCPSPQHQLPIQKPKRQTTHKITIGCGFVKITMGRLCTRDQCRLQVLTMLKQLTRRSRSVTSAHIHKKKNQDHDRLQVHTSKTNHFQDHGRMQVHSADHSLTPGSQRNGYGQRRELCQPGAQPTSIQQTRNPSELLTLPWATRPGVAIRTLQALFRKYPCRWPVVLASLGGVATSKGTMIKIRSAPRWEALSIRLPRPQESFVSQ